MTRFKLLLCATLACGPTQAVLAADGLDLDMIGQLVKPVAVSIAPTGDRVLVRWQQRDLMGYHRGPAHYEVLDRQGKRQGLLKRDGHTFADGVWRPDGRSIALVATHEGKTQLVSWRPGGGMDTTPLAGCAEGERVAAPTWSPDGRHIALYCVKGADPTAAPEKPATPKVLLASEGDLFGFEPVSVAASSRVVVTDADTQQVREVVAGQTLLAQAGTLIWAGPQSLMVVASAPGGDAGFGWSRQRHGTVYDLGDVSAPPQVRQWEGTRAPLLVSQAGQPVLLHPSGGGRKRVAAIEGFNTHYGFQLLVDDGSDSRPVFDAPLDWFVPAGEGDFHPLSHFRHYYANGVYYFPRFERGSRIVMAYRVGSDHATEVTSPALNITDFSISGDGSSMVVVQGDHNTPDDVYWYDLDRTGAEPVRLTRFQETILARYTPAPVHKLKWRSGDDRFDVEGWLLLPHGYVAGTRYPMIVDIHGGPGVAFRNDFDLLRYDGAHQVPPELYAQRGYAVLFVNPRGDPGYGKAFREALLASWGAAITEDILTGVDEAVRLGYADPERLGIAGASFGGWATAYAITQTDRFKAASSHDPVINNQIAAAMDYKGQKLSNYWLFAGYSGHHILDGNLGLVDPTRVRTPILLRFGLKSGDPYRPSQFFVSGLEYFTYLHTRCRPVEMIMHPEEGHGIFDEDTLRDYIRRDLAWFDYWLAGKGELPAGVNGLCAQTQMKAG